MFLPGIACKSLIVTRFTRRQVLHHLHSSSARSATRSTTSTAKSYGQNFTSDAADSSAPDSSPLQEIFDRMHTNGPTTLGTTQEYLDAQKRIEPKKLQCGIVEDTLRFSTTSYGRTLAAPHVHNNEHRVILKVHTKFLPLNETEYEILREVVGDRLNDTRNELRLTSNQFGSRIENKRHLVSMLDRIILSCQRLGRELEQETA